MKKSIANKEAIRCEECGHEAINVGKTEIPDKDMHYHVGFKCRSCGHITDKNYLITAQ